MTTSQEIKEFGSVTFQIGLPIGSPAYVPELNELLTNIYYYHPRVMYF